MRRHLLTLFLFALIATSISGYAYTSWSDTLGIKATMTFGTLALRYFGVPSVSDSDGGMTHGGTCACSYTDEDLSLGGYFTLQETVVNSYPGYRAECIFTIKNLGTLPGHIAGLEITPGPGLEVGEIILDANNGLIGWRFDATATGNPVLSIRIYHDAELSLVSNTLLSGEQIQGKLLTTVEQGAAELQTYSFEVNLGYD